MELLSKKCVVFLMAITVIFGGICARAEEPTPKQDEKTLTDDAVNSVFEAIQKIITEGDRYSIRE